MPQIHSRTLIRSLDRGESPLDVLARWPRSVPVCALLSAGGHPRWSRWSILARPTAFVRHAGGDPELEIDAALAMHATRSPGLVDPNDLEIPFVGGWIGWLSYDLGREFEPTAQSRSRVRCSTDDRKWPLFELFRCPAALVHDGLTGQWFEVGDEDCLPPLEEHPDTGTFEVGALESGLGLDAFEGVVARTVEYIRAGDIFQANLAHRLSGQFEGSSRALALRMLAASGAWYGAYMESMTDAADTGWHALCSLSPELFLEANLQSRQIVTRPIKGTRREGAQMYEALTKSEKDRAELAMIVDLMRNDLGRVCEYGSVHVDEARAIELHGRAKTAEAAAIPGVYHGVATIAGRLREGITAGAIIRAMFPAGSVTGAPKIRAMQIIDALEPVRRGPYCGSIGYFSDHGPMALNVAIRTASMSLLPGSVGSIPRGTLDYSIGAGIVAESNPETEWKETLDKAAVLFRGIGPQEVR